MHSLIRQQISQSQSGMEHQKIRFRSEKGANILPNPEQKTLSFFKEATHFITAFVIVFGTLMAYSNWSAYSVIAQDWIDSAFASADVKQIKESRLPTERITQKLSPDHAFPANQLLADIGTIPPGYYLEVPKLGNGIIPVQQVTNIDFNYAEAYDNAESSFQKALEEGVLHYPNTAMPGKYGNTFITGHSSYYPWAPGKYKSVFALLHKLEIGDEYYIYYNLRKYTYRVTEKFIVDPENISVLEQPTDKHISTLMTCTPIGTTLRRLIIRAELENIQG